MAHDDVRWQIVKVLLDEFPSLKEKVKEYINDELKFTSLQKLDS